MPNREFVLLADKYDPLKTYINGWFMSEKLDGQRAIWLPHTKGKVVSEIPFANRAKDVRPHISTGLWSRYGKVIHAPKWWLDNFPDYPMDGELFIARGLNQMLSSAIKTLPENRQDHKWKDVKYMVFDIPTLSEFYTEGKIHNATYKIEFDPKWHNHVPNSEIHFNSYDKLYEWLIMQWDNNWARANSPVVPVVQKQLPFNTILATDELNCFYKDIIENGGEGVILRKYTQLWTPRRVKTLVKMKPTNDDEGEIIGFTAGNGRLQGMMGNLILKWGFKQFELSGFTDIERTLKSPYNQMESGKQVISHTDAKIDFSPRFKIGDSITFLYRELSDDGIPKEARYFRPREDL